MFRLMLRAAILSAALFSGCAGPSGATTPSDVRPTPAQASTQPSRPDFAATMYVKGMSCPLCANNIDKQLLAVGGVEKVTINLGKGTVIARLMPINPPTRAQLEKAISESGFTLERIEMPPQ